MSRPVVGISAYAEQARWGVWDMRAVLVPQSYIDAVAAIGGVPVVLPPTGGLEAAADLVRRLDALVIAGGADVDPARYGAAADAHLGALRPDRDVAEMALAGAALESGVPMLGVCRGLQVLNVVLGGTLHQHLPDLLGTAIHAPAPGVLGRHPIKIADGSRLARAVKAPDADVSSYHHQSVDRLGAGLIATAWAPDGTIEAIELNSTDGRFALGVQWHPEFDREAAVFAALIEATTRR